MTEAFSHIYDGTIWKMDIHEAAGLLAIEWRDQNGLPYFSVIHYPSGRLLSDYIQYGDRWWTLAAISDDLLLVQHYPQANQGQTQALVAIDIHSKQVLWEQFNVQLVELVDDGIAVKQRFATGNNTVALLAPSSGDVIKHKVTLAELHPLTRNLRAPAPSQKTPFPSLTKTLVGPYFFLEIDDKELWAYHEQHNGTLRLMLAVIQNGQILANRCIIDQLEHLLPEVFFMIGQQMFFVRNNKREIVSYFV